MFQEYNMNQLHLPMDLADEIPERHVVRVINDAVDQLSDDIFDRVHPGGGRPPYHPKMMTKIIIYAYSQKIYTSRQIAKAVRENIPFMWLAARQKPDFRTINRFRSERMKDVLETVFTAVLDLLVAEGYIKLEHYFVDGTKIEANANRYTYVWGKAVRKYKARLQQKVKALFEEIEEMERKDEKQYGDQDLPEVGEASDLTSAKLEAAVARVEEGLQTRPKDKVRRRLVRKVRRTLLPRLQRYEEQEAILGDRNSYSKTDPDATFMRMKEDHIGNSQLKPGYNVQIGTENQFILGYSVHQRPTDTRCFIPHLERTQTLLGTLPPTVIADAGYGSEENYAYLEQKGLTPLVKYGTFHKERSRAWQRDVRRLENWHYDDVQDQWVCSNGRRLLFQYESRAKTDSGYPIRLRYYRSEDCGGCPFREQCTRTAGNRVIRVSMPFQRAKQKAREHLLSEEGAQLSAQRMTEVESVFGHIKHNRGFRRFLLRGLPKVTLEVGWLCLAHNLLKKAAVDAQAG